VPGTVLSAREAEYVVAARVPGAPDRSVDLRHILPNVLRPVIVLAAPGIARAIILGWTLSFSV
jgi:ABC-type dipeptide/oligopeptide/nickel transport system permease subunit